MEEPSTSHRHHQVPSSPLLMNMPAFFQTFAENRQMNDPRQRQQQHVGPPPVVLNLHPILHSLLNHFSSNWFDTCLWFLRIITLLFTFIYAIPIFGIHPDISFQKALISGAAASSLRLSQILPTLPDEQSAIKKVIFDDNFHYLLYCIIFQSCSPHLGILFPIFLSALLHCSGYTLTVLQLLNQGSTPLAHYLRLIHNENQAELLLAIAYCEILLFPYLLLMVYSGSCNLCYPFLLSQFLNLRYLSRRNPFTRQAFRDLRLRAEHHLVQNPECPHLVREAVRKFIDALVLLAPQIYDVPSD